MVAPKEEESALLALAASDPFPLYTTLRERDTGVERDSILPGWWTVTRYSDVEKVFRDHGTYSNNTFWELPGASLDQLDSKHMRFADMIRQSMLFQDPPVHARLRKLVIRAFTARAVDSLRPKLVALAERLLAEAPTGVEFDFMQAVAEPYPTLAIATMLGLPDEDHSQVFKWSMSTVSTFEPVLTAQEREQSIDSAMDFAAYLDRIADKRRRSPDDGLLSALIAAEEEGERLDGCELVSMINLLVTAGNLTTTCLLSSGMSQLVDDPDLVEHLRNEPAKISIAVDEMLRLDPAFHVVLRRSTDDSELGGKVIPSGSNLITVVAAANRDPRRYLDPDRLDINRSDGSHLTFGSGIHHCLGASLARLEGQIMISSVLKRWSGSFRRGLEESSQLPYLITRGCRNLPLILNDQADE